MPKKRLNIYRLLVWATLVVGICISLLLSHQQKQAIERHAVEQFKRATERIAQRISDHLEAHQLILRSGAALFESSETVGRHEWRSFIEHVSEDQIVSGMQGVGFTKLIRSEELQMHIDQIRAEGFPQYRVWPEKQRDIYSAIIYLEPFDERNQRAFGFDMFSEPVRQQAMKHAWDSGSIALSGKVTLKQEIETDTQAGVLMYFPVYRSGMPIASVEERRLALFGWTYAPYRINDLIDNLLSDWRQTDGRNIDLHIYDGEKISPETLMFDSIVEQTPSASSHFRQLIRLNFHGKIWTLQFDPIGGLPGIQYAPVYIVLVSGLGLSGLLFALLMSLLHTRESANQIAEALTEDVRRNEERLRESERQLHEAQRIARVGSWRLDVTSSKLTWTAEVYRMFGFGADDSVPDLESLAKRFTAESWAALNSAMDKTRRTGQPYELELEMLRPDGSHGWMHARGEAVCDDNGKVRMLQGVASDITERKQAQARIQLAASVFNHAREGIMVTDANGSILDVNDAFVRITGYDRAEVLGKNPNILKSGRHQPEFYTAMWNDLAVEGYWSGEVWNRRKSGEVFPQLLTISSISDADGWTNQYVALFTDISHLKEHEQQLERIAHYDALTGLPNRVLLTDRLQQAMIQARRRRQTLAVVFIDLDKFKEVNDNYGHEAGDMVLITFAERMKQSLRAGDTIARLGGDEFVAVLPDLPDIKTSLVLIDRLILLAAQPINIGSHSVEVSASVGVTYYPQAEEVDGDLLMRQADMAMYQAKLAGRNCYSVFDVEHDRSLRGHHEHVKSIEQALAQGELRLYYQPKVNMRSGELIGAEALIRWQHPQRGLLLPSQFLSAAENNTLAVRVGEWVITTAFKQMKVWQDMGLHIPVSINISGYHLLQGGFVERLTELLTQFPEVNPTMLELEVLESNALGDITKVAHVIDNCKKFGVSFALDDFGTGYSSLTYLKHLHAVTLKIDKSFVLDMLEDPEDLSILEGVLGLAHAFRRQAVAEGVETLEHGEMLLNLGCEIGQGYAIARPMPAQELPAWLNSWQPDEAWKSAMPFRIRNLPFIYAIVEHRAWVRALEAALEAEHEAPPDMDVHQCNFGIWLDTELEPRAMPEFDEVQRRHSKVHELAVQEHLLYTEGKGAEALKNMQALRAASQELVDELKRVMSKGN
jgi:diguanylate cyclase (GGDEF)-like protein/PAS domain S-box-containing protein